MKRFDINNEKITPGIYKYSSSGLITIWDIRIKTPNSGDYLTPEIMHTIEHTLSSYLSSRYGVYRIVGVYPIGSQTGFRVLTRFIGRTTIFEALLDYIESLNMTFFVVGDNREQCGRADLHDLLEAKKVMNNYRYYLEAFQTSALNYRK